MVSAIETDSLTKRFGTDILAVDSLDFVVEEGEIFGFLGPNGAGKSTTINMLLDFIRPSSGSASVLGYDTQEESEAIRERIGVLPEGYDVYERLSGREHLQYAIDIKEANTDPDTLIDRIGLAPDDARRPAGGYSKGMTQRLALGMALVGDPDLLILDEPASGLDPTGIQEMRELIRSEAEHGTAVFFSSHILSEVEAVCDRIGIINNGHLVALDTIENLRNVANESARISVTLNTLPDSLDVENITGVTDIEVDGSTVTAICEDASVKVDIVTHLDSRATVTDIVSSETSLEELFNSYTNTDEAIVEPQEVAA